ncbi:hypothetical protein Sjap_020858 [Stephania japonica]|uniref:S-protein homolog n=1 Tax=Stephania japonica TaxID=461633 RepID=A0AAP0I103_9MAGN
MRNQTYIFLGFLSFNLLCMMSLSFKMEVRIVNGLGYGERANLHCFTRDRDMGYRVLADGEEFVRNFKVRDKDINMTMFSCDVQWGMGTWYHFDAYDDVTDRNRCVSECLWVVTNDWLYVYNQMRDIWEFWPYEPIM